MIIHCPNCHKVLAKGFDELDMIAVDFSFQTRCAHCHAQVELSVKCVKIERTISGAHPLRRSTDPPPEQSDDGRVYVSD